MHTYDPTDLVGQAQTKAERETKERLAKEEEDGDIRWLMASRRGRRHLWRLLDRSGVFRISFNTNAMQMAFNEGNRNYGNRILDSIHALCPELYPVMVRENTKEKHGDGDGPKHN